MKKRITSIFLTLVLTLCLVGNAFAAETESPVTATDISATRTVTAAMSEDNTYITLTVNGLTSGTQYLVLMVSGIVTDPAKAQITEDTIKYIDQASSNGSVTFTVYPSSMQDSTILFSGSDQGLAIVATVKMPYILGDVDKDTFITSKDAVMLNRHLAKIDIITDETSLLAADINKKDGVESTDAVELNRHLAGLTTISN